MVNKNNFNDTDIEKIGTTLIKYLCARINLLDEDIPEGDKGVSFDGTILLYKNPNKKVSDLEDAIDVQVKSCNGQKEYKLKSVSYRLEKKHFLNYKKKQGVLFLYVISDENGCNERLFYKEFFIDEVIQILEKNKAKTDEEKISFKLSEIDITSQNKFKNFLQLVKHFSRIKKDYTILQKPHKLSEIKDYESYKPNFRFSIERQKNNIKPNFLGCNVIDIFNQKIPIINDSKSFRTASKVKIESEKILLFENIYKWTNWENFYWEIKINKNLKLTNNKLAFESYNSTIIEVYNNIKFLNKIQKYKFQITEQILFSNKIHKQEFEFDKKEFEYFLEFIKNIEELIDLAKTINFPLNEININDLYYIKENLLEVKNFDVNKSDSLYFELKDKEYFFKKINNKYTYEKTEHKKET